MALETSRRRAAAAVLSLTMLLLATPSPAVAQSRQIPCEGGLPGTCWTLPDGSRPQLLSATVVSGDRIAATWTAPAPWRPIYLLVLGLPSGPGAPGIAESVYPPGGSYTTKYSVPPGRYRVIVSGGIGRGIYEPNNDYYYESNVLVIEVEGPPIPTTTVPPRVTRLLAVPTVLTCAALRAAGFVTNLGVRQLRAIADPTGSTYTAEVRRQATAAADAAARCMGSNTTTKTTAKRPQR